LLVKRQVTLKCETSISCHLYVRWSHDGYC